MLLRPLIDPLTYPTEREVPQDILRCLRDVSPRAELVYMGNGRWWLGEVREGVARIESGRRSLARLRAIGGPLPSWRRARLMAEGFGMLASIFAPDLDSSVADLLSTYVTVSARDVERAEAGVLDAAEGGPQLRQRAALLRQYAEQEARWTHRFAFRHARSVTVDAPLTA